MQSVCTRLNSDVNDRAWLPSVFSRGVLLQVEFLNRVDRENGRRVAGDSRSVNDCLPGVGLTVVQAINEVGIVLGAQAVGARGGEATARIAHHARTELQQVLVVTAIERQIVDLFVAESPAQSGGGRIQQRHVFGDYDGFRNASRLQRQVDTNVLRHFQSDVSALESLEALGLGADLVGARGQVGHDVAAVVVGRNRTARSPLNVGDRDHGSLKRRPGLVSNGAQEPAIYGLGREGKAAHKS